MFFSKEINRLIIVPVGTMGPFLLEGNPFKNVEGLVNHVCDRGVGARASPSEVHPGGKF